MTQKSEKIDEDFIIDKMIKLIEKGWCKYASAKDKDGCICPPESAEVVTVDILGALIRTTSKHNVYHLSNAIVAKIRNELTHRQSVTSFNDSSATTKADVIAFLKKVKANANKT